MADHGLWYFVVYGLNAVSYYLILMTWWSADRDLTMMHQQLQFKMYCKCGIEQRPLHDFLFSHRCAVEITETICAPAEVYWDITSSNVSITVWNAVCGSLKGCSEKILFKKGIFLSVWNAASSVCGSCKVTVK